MQTNRLKKRSRIPYEDMLANILKNDEMFLMNNLKKPEKHIKIAYYVSPKITSQQYLPL